MGSKDDSTPGKTSKQTTPAQEASTTPSYFEWPTPIPAYYGPGAAPSPAFYPPTVSSPTPHPYMWAGQHLMPPYGTPLPYPPIYPHGGLYAHPSMAAVQGTALPGKENEGKSNGKERGSAKKSEGHSGLASGKSGEVGKAISGSTSDGASQSGDSGSEGSSVASDENGNQQDTANKKKSFDQMLADGANAQHSGGAGDSSFSTRPAKLPVSAPGKVAAPATNLKIGMDIWSPAPAAGVPMKGRPATVSPGPDQMWISDERELKRQRRKQSNRESARRSRLRKQAEFEELAAKADALSNENQTLRAELQCLAEKCKKLESENDSIMLHSHFSRQGLRGPPRRLIVGNSGDIRNLIAGAQSKPMDFNHRILHRVIPHYHRWSAQYGRTFVYWFGSTPRVAISSPDLIKEVLVNRGGAYGRKSQSPLSGQLLGGGLVALAGEKWARHRRIANSAFSSERVKDWIPVAVGCTERMLQAWEEKWEGPEPFEMDVHGELHALTADIISRTAFGSCYDDSRRVFRLQEQQMSLVSQALRSVYIPGFRFLPTRKNMRRRRLEKEINGLLRKLIEINWDESDSSGNLLGQMISANKNQREDDRISMEEIVGECKTFYFAGKETTANLLTWALLLLALHQDWQDRARQEVLLVLGPHGTLTSDHLNQLKLVGMILDETLRLYAPAVMLMRETSKDVQLGTFKLPAGTQLYLAMLAVHHDCELWGEDAEEFNPMRFSEPRKHLAAFFPFGLGPRICVGQHLAAVEARIIVAMVLRCFALKVSPSYVHAPIQFITLQPQFGAPGKSCIV